MKVENCSVITEEMHRFYIDGCGHNVIHQAFTGMMDHLYKENHNQLFSEKQIRKVSTHRKACVLKYPDYEFSIIKFMSTATRPHATLFTYVLRTYQIGTNCCVSIIRNEFKNTNLEAYESVIKYLDDRMWDFFSMFRKEISSYMVGPVDFTDSYYAGKPIADILEINVFEKFDLDYKYDDARRKYEISLEDDDCKKNYYGEDDTYIFYHRFVVKEKETDEIVFIQCMEDHNGSWKLGEHMKINEDKIPHSLSLIVKLICSECNLAVISTRKYEDKTKPSTIESKKFNDTVDKIMKG